MITRIVWRMSLCLLVAGCALPGDQDLYERVEIAALECPDEPVDYATQVFPVLNTACGSCHGPPGLGGLTLSDESGVVTEERMHSAIVDIPAVTSDKLLVLSGSEADSYFVDVLLQRDAPLMPQGGPPLSQEDIQLVRCWVEQGAAP